MKNRELSKQKFLVMQTTLGCFFFSSFIPGSLQGFDQRWKNMLLNLQQISSYFVLTQQEVLLLRLFYTVIIQSSYCTHVVWFVLLSHTWIDQCNSYLGAWASAIHMRSMLHAKRGRWEEWDVSYTLLRFPPVSKISIISCRLVSHLTGSPKRITAGAVKKRYHYVEISVRSRLHHNWINKWIHPFIILQGKS